MAEAVRIGTRASKLALAQADIVRTALEAAHSGIEIVIVPMTTRGDRVLDRPLSAIGDKGLFVAEIEQALRDGRIDVAVHSAKDLPADLPGDLVLAAFPERADPRDVLVSPRGDLDTLDIGSRVGTSSLRRACQLRARRPDLHLFDLRGNVDTRLRKLRDGEYDAIVLAAAGLHRLGLNLGGNAEIDGARVTYLEPGVMLPAAAQGALAIEIKRNDARLAALVAPLDDAETRDAVLAERAFVAAVGGGCQVPVGAYGRVHGREIVLAAMLGHPDGRVLRAEARSSRSDGPALGARLARHLLDSGGSGLLEAVSDGAA